MRNGITEHSQYKDGESLLEELDNCQIFCIGKDEDSDDFVLSCFGCHNDPLYVTREELAQIGHAIIAEALSHKP